MSAHPKDDESDSFPCPECGSLYSAVIDTRQSKGRRRRRRRCEMGHRYTTIEVMASEIEAVVAASKQWLGRTRRAT